MFSMPDYVTVIGGIAHDYSSGVEYDVLEAHIVYGETVVKAYEEAGQKLKTIEGKLHLPKLEVKRLAPLGEDVYLALCKSLSLK